MTFSDSVMVSLTGISVVFLVLIMLSFLIKVQSVALGYISVHHSKLSIAAKERKDAKNVPVKTETAITAEVPATADEGWSAGELNLLGVDEKTAAMIMAIVSHESQIPLSELQFKMIKAID